MLGDRGTDLPIRPDTGAQTLIVRSLVGPILVHTLNV